MSQIVNHHFNEARHHLVELVAQLDNEGLHDDANTEAIRRFTVKLDAMHHDYDAINPRSPGDSTGDQGATLHDARHDARTQGNDA